MLRAIGITMALIMIAISVMFHLLGVAQREKMERQRIEGETTIVQEKSWKDVYLDDGTIDLELAKELGAIGRDEYKEKRDVTRNKAAGEYAKENYQAIEEAAKEYIKSEIGREVEILNIDAIFPYSALYIGYQTIEEPIAGGDLMYGIKDNAFTKEHAFEKLNLYQYRSSVVVRLYTILYKEQLKEINQFIASEFPKYVGFGTLESGEFDEELKSFWVNWVEKVGEKSNTATEEIMYNSFIKNPSLDAQNLKKILDVENLKVAFILNVYIRDEATIPNEVMVDEIYDRLMSSKYKNYLHSNAELGILIEGFLVKKNSQPVVGSSHKSYDFRDGE